MTNSSIVSRCGFNAWRGGGVPAPIAPNSVVPAHAATHMRQSQGGQSEACPPLQARALDGWHGASALLPTFVLAKRIKVALFREEWPSRGGRRGWAADRSDRCPPKP